jgi:hypothetical protein
MGFSNVAFSLLAGILCCQFTVICEFLFACPDIWLEKYAW